MMSEKKFDPLPITS
jgi:hypothetical protein